MRIIFLMLLLGGGLAVPILAQTSSEAAPNSNQNVEEVSEDDQEAITVTGSRIRIPGVRPPTILLKDYEWLPSGLTEADEPQTYRDQPALAEAVIGALRLHISTTELEYNKYCRKRDEVRPAVRKTVKRRCGKSLFGRKHSRIVGEIFVSADGRKVSIVQIWSDGLSFGHYTGYQYEMDASGDWVLNNGEVWRFDI